VTKDEAESNEYQINLQTENISEPVTEAVPEQSTVTEGATELENTAQEH